MKDKTTEKTELEQLKVNLEKQLFANKQKLYKILISEIKPAFEKKYNNTYWKYKDSYGEKRGWFAYVHVKKVADIWDIGNNGVNCRVLCDTFQITSDKKLIIEFDTEIYYGSLEKKLTKKEFTNAVSKMLNKAKEAIK